MLVTLLNEFVKWSVEESVKESLLTLETVKNTINYYLFDISIGRLARHSIEISKFVAINKFVFDQHMSFAERHARLRALDKYSQDTPIGCIAH